MSEESTGEKKYIYRTIISRINEMIESGELTPGDRLPPERKLAERFMVSRNSLRQALQALAERKIIESRQGDGTYLLNKLSMINAEDAILEAIREKQDIIHDIIELRQILEPKIAALASQRITRQQLDALKIVVCDQQSAVLNGREDGGLDAQFHQKLAEATGNKVLIQVMETIQTVLDESRTTWLQSVSRRTASVEGHFRILDAIESRNAEGASLAMAQHIEEIERLIFDDKS